MVLVWVEGKQETRPLNPFEPGTDRHASLTYKYLLHGVVLKAAQAFLVKHYCIILKNNLAISDVLSFPLELIF